MPPGPRRDPTANTAIAQVLKDEASARGMTLRQYLRKLAASDPDASEHESDAARLRRLLTTL